MSIDIFKGLIWGYDNRKEFLADMADFYQACHQNKEKKDGFTKRADAFEERMKRKKRYEY